MAEPITFTREDSDRLVRLETSVTHQAETIAEMNDNVKKLVDHIEAQNVRITTLENRSTKQKWFIAGISSTVSFLVSAAAFAFSFFHK